MKKRSQVPCKTPQPNFTNEDNSSFHWVYNISIVTVLDTDFCRSFTSHRSQTRRHRGISHIGLIRSGPTSQSWPKKDHHHPLPSSLTFHCRSWRRTTSCRSYWHRMSCRWPRAHPFPSISISLNRFKPQIGPYLRVFTKRNKDLPTEKDVFTPTGSY